MTENKNIIEMIKNRKAIVMGQKAQDGGWVSDPFLGRFMEGRIACETNEIEWLDRLLGAIE